MTRAVASGNLTVYRSGTVTMVPALVITRRDLEVFRLVGHDRDITDSDGNVYESAPGLDISSLVSTDGMPPDNAEFKVLDSADAIITRADILAGLWSGAGMEIGMLDCAVDAPELDVLKAGTLGIAKAFRGYFSFEFRDIRQAAQNSHDTVLQPTCRYKLGDAKCGVDLSSVSDGLTATGTLTAVTSQYQVTDSGRTEADDWFGDGYLTFTTGMNAGYPPVKVKTFAAGVFVFWNQWIFPISIGNEYTVTAGCRFRPFEDCRDKFDNIINFGGEFNLRNPDSLTAPAQ